MYHRVPVKLDGIKVVSDMIRNAFESKKAFSLIRLGDGEAVILGYPSFIGNYRYARWMTNFFGNETSDPTIYAALKPQLIGAIETADIIGISSQACDDMTAAQQEMLRLSEKGETLTHEDKVTLAALEWGILFELTKGVFREHQVLTTTSIHKDLERVGLIKQLIEQSSHVNIITGNDLELVFKSKYPRKTLNFFRVPTEYKFEKDRSHWASQKPHFPDVFGELMSTIHNGDFPGLSLVGAGPCGKVYCNAIRQAGGFALDIGSIMDLWAGRNTRSFIPDMNIVTF